jgi:hypothetical protein
MLNRSRHVQRLMFLFAVAGLFAVTADFACLEDVCADSQTAAYHSMGDINKDRIRTLDEGLAAAGQTLTPDQKATLARDGQLLGVVKLTQPVRHPNGTVEMPTGWLKPLPEGHPWAKKLTPSDDAYYSFVEERIFRSKLFDPANPEHVKAANTYLAKYNSGSPEFLGWSAESRTECEKKKTDARGTGTDPAVDAM